jgi:ACR3 family arsenite efflux pump ArsB
MAIAATPILLLLQSVLLPLYLWLLTVGEIHRAINSSEFLQVCLGLILLPMGLALFTEQWAKFHAPGERWLKLTSWLPVPLLSPVLLLIAATQVKALLGRSLVSMGNVIL